MGVQGTDCEWLNGKTGLPEGSSLKNYKKKGKVSRCSEAHLSRVFEDYDAREEETFKWEAVRARV